MMIKHINKYFFLISLCSMVTLAARELILEFKGAYFLPINSSFRDLYKGGLLYGPELTVQLFKDKNWYGFASVDYYHKKGRYLSPADSTKISILPLALGIKYFVPAYKCLDFYLGLGFQPAYIRTKSKHGCVTAQDTQWAYGIIGKVGTYISLPHHFVVDLFVDYSFLKTTGENLVLPSNPNISAVIFGGGLGYRF